MNKDNSQQNWNNNINLENHTISSFSEKKNYDSLTSLQNTDQIYNFHQNDEYKPPLNYHVNNSENLINNVIFLIKVN